LEQYVAARPEFTLKRVFVDNGETGVDFLRPSWNDLLSECRAGKINCVVVKDLSRVGRNYIETGEYLDKIFPLLGVRLIAVNDGYDNLNITTNTQLMANLKNLANDIYAKDISRKIRAAFRIKQQNGDFLGTFAAYGYQKVYGEKNKIEVDPETAPIVRQMFKWKAEGVGNKLICRRLNNAGIPSPCRYRFLKGILKAERYAKSQWGESIIRQILENPVYLGNMAQGKNISSLCDGIKLHSADKRDWIIVEGTHEPIVTQELFDTVRGVMEQRKAEFKAMQGKYAHFKTPEMILKGLVFCADCGKPLHRYKFVLEGGKYCDWVYLCRTNVTFQTCPIKNIHETVLNKAVYDALRLRIQMCADVTGIIEKLNRESSHNSRLERFDAEIEEAEREIKRISTLRQGVFEDYAQKVLTVSEYKYANEKYDADDKKQHQRIEAAKCDKAEYTQGSTSANKWLAAFSRFMDTEELTADMAQALIERVEVSTGRRVNVIFKFNDEFAAICEYANYPGVV
jgi:DNA invertase Pin-like site-specific DNA recombinase